MNEVISDYVKVRKDRLLRQYFPIIESTNVSENYYKDWKLSEILNV